MTQNTTLIITADEATRVLRKLYPTIQFKDDMKPTIRTLRTKHRLPQRERFLAGSFLNQVAAPVTKRVSASKQAEQLVAEVIDQVAAARTNKQVKAAVQRTLGPGRPRKHTTAAEGRKHRRHAEREKLALLLQNYGISIDQQIPAALRTKYDISATTYRQLLTDESHQAKVIADLTATLVELGILKTPAGLNVSAGEFMNQADQGKGQLVTGGYGSAKVDVLAGVRQQQESDLSAPLPEPESAADILFGRTPVPTGDRRRTRPAKSMSDYDEQVKDKRSSRRTPLK